MTRDNDELEPRIEVVICDPASLEVVRRAKKVKTDKVDARRMVRALRAWDGGEAEALSQVRVPSIEEEDGRRLLRRRDRLVRERVRLTNTIKGLLKTQGVFGLNPLKTSFLDDLKTAETGSGGSLQPGLCDEIAGLHDILAVVVGQLADIERKKAAVAEASEAALQTADGDRADEAAVALLARLKGVGVNDALLLGKEVLWRDFRNRRELAGWAGLAPVPWASGSVDRNQGISKAGSAMMRRHLIQLAWRWLRWQPDSDLAGWYREYVAARDGRSRKRGIVALARKLLVALWRYATTGLVPVGAVTA